MILIFSSSEDSSTNEVLKWLKYYESSFFRVNNIDLCDQQYFEMYLSNKGEALRFEAIDSLDNYTSIWIRRGGFSFSMPLLQELKHKKQEIHGHFVSEQRSLISYINDCFDDKTRLGSFNLFEINKLASLKLARKVGLKIPDTIISTNKNVIIDFFNSHESIITKNIQDILIFSENDDFYFTYTELILSDIINSMPDSFPPSLFQEKIEKEFEIRSFYLDGIFYSMAIFSQSDSQTQIDFRKYNNQNPNRITPFKLPLEIEEMLHRFMVEIKLNTGSFDLIYSKNKEFVFLELNPIGQYDMVSRNCNYFIDKEIAKYLINKSNSKCTQKVKVS